VFTRRGWVCATLSISLTRSVSSSGALAIGYVGTNWELDFKQCSFHHIMQVLRVCRFSTFALPPALPPCCCPLAFQHQVRRLASRISSESYPGYPECAVSCHGAGRFANSIRPLCAQAQDRRYRSQLCVEQPILSIFVLLSPFLHVFRHPVLASLPTPPICR